MKRDGLINRIGYKASLYLKRNSSSILTCIGATGGRYNIGTNRKSNP